MWSRITKMCRCGRDPVSDRMANPTVMNSPKSFKGGGGGGGEGANASTRALSSSPSEEVHGTARQVAASPSQSRIQKDEGSPTTNPSTAAAAAGKKKVEILISDSQKWNAYQKYESNSFPVFGRKDERSKTLDADTVEKLKRYVNRNKLAQEKEAECIRTESAKLIAVSESFVSDTSCYPSATSSLDGDLPVNDKTKSGEVRKNIFGMERKQGPDKNTFLRPNQPISKQSVRSVPVQDVEGKIEALDVFSPDVRSLRWREFEVLLNKGGVEGYDEFVEAGKRVGREKAFTVAAVKLGPEGGFSTLH